MFSLVEVLVDSAWREGELLDIQKNSVCVRLFEGKVGSEWFPANLVRLCSKEPVTPVFQPSAEVEVKEDHAWRSARIKTVKGGFYFIEMTGSKREKIVEAESLRKPIGSTPTLDTAGLQRVSLPVEQSVAFELSGICNDIQKKCGLLHAGVVEGNAVLLIGDANAVRRSRMLLEVHLKYQQEIVAHAQRKQQELEKHSIEFTVPSEVVGVLIGKGGERIHKIQQDLGVTALFLGTGKRITVRVSGKSEESLKKSREMLEFSARLFPIPIEKIGWLVGRGTSKIAEIKQQTGILVASIMDHIPSETGTKIMELIGTSEQIEDTIALIEGHLGYFDAVRPVYSREGRFQPRSSPKVVEPRTASSEQPLKEVQQPAGAQKAEKNNGRKTGKSQGKENSGVKKPIINERV